MKAQTLSPRSALFLPASNPRATDKARSLPTDMVLLDLEDAVPEDAKARARDAAVEAVARGFGGRLAAIRLNGFGHGAHDADVQAVRASRAGYAVLPKAEDPEAIAALAATLGKPLLVMIETPRGVLSAPAIAALDGVYGLIAGTNDLRSELGIPSSAGRGGLTMALQSIVLAARAGACWALDGVFNALEDQAALERECGEGRDMGFDGKTVIHPNQIAAANRAFSPTAAEVEEARALIAAATGGAERFRGRMVEAMHVDQARAMLARADTH